MSQHITIKSYHAIIRKLKYHASFDEVMGYLDREDLPRVSQRTFQRYLNDIRSIYDIDIVFDNSEKRYYTVSNNDGNHNYDMLYTAFELFDAMKTSERLASSIQLETREKRNTQYIADIVKAIDKRNILKFKHKKYTDGIITDRQLEPYILKEYRNRWFIMGKDLKDNIYKTFALDRIIELSKTPDLFIKDESINIENYFMDCFGIIKPTPKEQDKPQKIKMKVSNFQSKYLESLPLHASQKIITNNKREKILTLDVYSTFDLEMEIMSMGAHVTVLEPKWFANKIKNGLKKAFEKY